MASLDATQLTVQQLLKLRATCKNDEECSNILIEQHNFDVSHRQSIRRKISKCVEKVKTLKKNKNRTLDQFLKSEFTLNESTNQIISNVDEEDGKRDLAQKIIDQTKEVILENRELKRKYADLEEKQSDYEEQFNYLREQMERAILTLSDVGLEYKDQVSQKECTLMEKKLNLIETKYQRQSETVAQLSEKLINAQTKLSKCNSRNINKRMKRREENVQALKTKVVQVQKEKVKLEAEISKQNSYLRLKDEEKSAVKSEKHQLQKTISRMRSQMESLKLDTVNLHNRYEEETTVFELQKEKQSTEIKQLKDVIEILESDSVQTFCEGKYTNEVRECCMSLLTECNVSMNKLPNIIRTVLLTFTGKIPDRLPSKALLSWMMAEAKMVACKQVAEAMLEDFDASSNQGNVLHQDATTKFHDHYEGAQVTLKSGKSLSIGLRQVSGGDGQTYTNAFQEMVTDLAESLGKGREENEARLICSIKSFMSDQCATNNIFNNNIETLRKTLIPAFVDNYDQLSDNEKNSIMDMGHFSCRLHLLANFGSEADKALASFENTVCEGRNPHSFNNTESGSIRLARTSAKAFTKRGSDKSGVHSYFETYLRGKQEENHLVTFHGHRINVVFHDCAAVYHHKHHIASFLDDWPDPNGLLKSVHFDVKEPAYLAGCRAMGILDKLVTGPFWRILEKEGSILSINDDLNQMRVTLTNWAQNGKLPLSGEVMFNESRVNINKDHIYSSLFSEVDPSTDSLTVLALELLCAQLLILLERQAKSQLPEGQYWEADRTCLEMASNVPKTNTISERDMAVLDNLLRAKPASSTLTLEAIIMCTKNKPFSWLRSLDDATRNKVIDDARQMAPSIRAKFKERKIKLEEEMTKKLSEKKKKVEMKESKEKNTRIQLSRDISQYGGPWGLEELRLSQNTMEKTELRKALLVQIKFHKSVLGSKGSKELFQESANKQKFTENELAHNLRTIIEQNNVGENIEEKPHGLQYKDLETSRTEINEKKNELKATLFKAREKRKIILQKKSLPEFLENPESLVGKRVQHKCIENGQEMWFDGSVMGIKVKKPNTIRTEYTIVYDEDPDNEWFFPLLVDLKNGDLMLK